MSRKLEQIAQRFDDAKPVGENQWEARCPVHEDRTASLSIGQPDGSGKVLLYCHAGCATRAVLAERGLVMADLMSGDRNGHAGGSRRIVATYDYRDEQGNLVSQAVRYDPKDFRQRRPKDGGGWEWKVKGMRVIPYRLAELAKQPEAPVFIAEGEKDADNLAKIGLLGTTNAGGAGKWKKAHAECLKDRDVVILPDNDNPGRDHAGKVAKSLQGIAASVKVLELPGLSTKGDVSDWLADGGTKEQLLQLAGEAPELNLGVPKARSPEGSNVDDDTVTNALIEFDEDEKPETIPLAMLEVLRRIQASTKGFPKRVGSMLFAAEKERAQWLLKPAALFGWLAAQLGVIQWHKVRGCVTKEEVLSQLEWMAEEFLAVEELPHEPPIDQHFYLSTSIKPGDGRKLNALLKRFNPATDADRDLILAAFLTPMWGGPGGTRPVFVVTSDDGRGSGKSKLAEMVSHVYGGQIQLSQDESIDALKTRLLSAEALTKRVAVLDNVKSLKLSWAQLEALITSPVISGKRMYVGEGSRPNTLAMFLTLNGACLSTDMAQRAIVIKIKRPTYSENWEEETAQFIQANRKAILGDILAIMRQPAAKLERFSRWALWERDVLARLPEPEEAQRLIVERQGAVDVDAEEGEILEDYIATKLAWLGYEPEQQQIHLPSEIIGNWYNAAMNEREKTISISRILKQGIGEGKYRRLQVNPSKAHGRGFLWFGRNANVNMSKATDLEERLQDRLELEKREREEVRYAS